MLKETKSRVILFILIVIVIFIAIFAFIFFKRKKETETLSEAALGQLPSIKSIPGARNAPAAYKEAVESQNIKAAEQAAKTQGSSVPTIIEPTYIGPKTFSGKTQAPECNLEELKKARLAGVRPEELYCKGCTARELNTVGYMAGELKSAGFTADQLKEAGYSADQMKTAGFTVQELKKAGMTTADLKAAGYSASQLKNIGVVPADLKAAGYTAQELKEAGYTPDALREAGYSTAEVTAAEATKEISKQPGFPKDCSPQSLKKALQSNIPPEQIYKQLNCEPKSLKDAGYSASQLKKAGYSAGALRDAGVGPKDLKAAGATSEELRGAGYTAAQLKKAGFSPEELKKADFTRGDLLRAGFTPAELKESISSPLSENFPKDCSPESLKKASVANVPVSEIRKALGCNVKSLNEAGYSPKQLKDGGFSAEELKKSGMEPLQLKDAGATPAELKALGSSLKELVNAKYPPEALRAAGYSAKELKDAGVPVETIKSAGYPEAELRAAGIASEPLKAAGFIENLPGFPKDCSQASLIRAKSFNLSADKIRQALNCDATSFKASGYRPEELKKAGFTAGQLKAAGFTNGELLHAGYLPDEVKAASELIQQPTSPSGQASETSKVTLPEIGQVPSLPSDKQAQFLADLRKQQAEQLSDQQRQAALQQLQQAMATQASDLIGSWSPPPTQNFVIAAEEVKETTKLSKEKTSGLGSQKENVIKAGTVMFGVLDTGINSDQESPILATVIQGKLKGAKLIGNFVRRDERVIVSFQTINIPELKNTIGVNAVAIDPSEARTALASRVDNHYLLRYGSLFASSFLSGLSSAITQSNSTTATNANTGIVIQSTPKLNTGEKALVALGNVGQQYSSVLGQNFTKPPTVHVDAGAGVGLLFMSDLVIPENDEQLDVLLSKEEEKEKERVTEERKDAMERADLERKGYRERAREERIEATQPGFVPPGSAERVVRVLQ